MSSNLVNLNRWVFENPSTLAIYFTTESLCKSIHLGICQKPCGPGRSAYRGLGYKSLCPTGKDCCVKTTSKIKILV